MKKSNVPSEIKLLSLVLVSFIIMFSCCVYHNYYTYNNMKVVMKENVAVEYGSANYNLSKLIQKVDGKIVSVKRDINTNVVGSQEAIVEIKKDNVIKTVPVVISVVDTVAPIISLKEEKVTITKGDDYDLSNNIDFIRDDVDGDISYLEDVHENSTNYYHIDSNREEISNVGEHEIKVTAKDKAGNTSSMTYILEVVAPVVVVPETPAYQPQYYVNAAPNVNGNDLVSIAYSLIGSPYISGSNGPYGFDCSGFVQYVYSRIGISISRSSSTQYREGVPVSYQDAQPGDILSWGYVDGVPTHSALYVGNGQMVHATNPRQGVIASDVAAWTRGSGSHVIAVRRIN